MPDSSPRPRSGPSVRPSSHGPRPRSLLPPIMVWIMTRVPGGPPRCHHGRMRGRVLVVDDDTALAEMLGIVLRGEGFDPVFCADGSGALEVFRNTRPDLVLLDLMLPGRD